MPWAPRTSPSGSLRRIGEAAPIERIPALELLARARAALADFDRAGEALAELTGIVERLGTPYPSGRARLVAGEVAELTAATTRRRVAASRTPSICSQSPRLRTRRRFRGSPSRGRSPRWDARTPPARRPRARARRSRSSAPSATRRDPARSDRQRAGSASSPLASARCSTLIAQGLSDAEIAERLVVSPHTVHRHVANVRTKLRLPSRAAAVAYATREGLL